MGRAIGGKKCNLRGSNWLIEQIIKDINYAFDEWDLSYAQVLGSLTIAQDTTLIALHHKQRECGTEGIEEEDDGSEATS